MNKLFFGILAVATALLSSCGSDHFTVKGEFTDTGTQSIRIAYATNDGIESAWITISDNNFTFDGSSDEPAILYIFNQQRRLIAHIMVENGDKINITGDMALPYNLDVSGTDENEEWYEFINKNSNAFSKNDRKEADAAIEKYIRENPDNVVSILLLTNDYSSLTDETKVKELLGIISNDARPESIMRNFYVMQSSLDDAAKKERITSMQLYSNRDSIETFSPYHHTLNLLYFWSPDDESRSADIKKLKDFKENLASSRLNIADINLDNDTTRWKNAIRNDSVKWTRYWAIGGVVSNPLRNLRLTSTPYYIVADSTGKQLYHGNSFPAASQLIQSRLK